MRRSDPQRRQSIWFLLGVAIIAWDDSPTASSFVLMPTAIARAKWGAVSEKQKPIFLDRATATATATATALAAATEEESQGSEKADSSSAAFDPEEEVKRRLAKAKEVLAKSKAKLGSQASNENSAVEPAAPAAPAPVPFFAGKKIAKDPQRREKVIKAKDDKTGLVTADGEKMAAMSEKEEWERRSLLEVFENEIDENEDVYSIASQQLAERDVAASIWNLRKQMKTEDYLRIFDKKNRFIGEDN